MDQVLIVDGDNETIAKLKDGFKDLAHFKTIFANDGEAALQVLKKEKIAVLVVDINTPKIDGLELLAYMSRNHQTTPCILMTEYGKPWFHDRAEQQDVLYHIEKPLDLGALASAIFVGLNLNDEGLSNKGMSMSSFLPLIEVEQRTCRLEVKTLGNRKGYFYFEKGELLDALLGDQSGEKAALEMASWNQIKIKFTDLPRRRTARRIRMNLMDMAGASWARDEEEELPPSFEDPNENQHAQDKTTEDEIFTGDTLSPDYRDILQSALKSRIQLLKGIKGYQAIGILDPQGSILAYDPGNQKEDIEQLGFTLNQTFQQLDEAAGAQNLVACNGLTAHTPKRILIFSKHALNAQNTFHAIGSVAIDGNWFFMKIQMDEMMSQIIKDLALV